MTFSRTVIQLRKQAKATQADIAKKLGISRQTYADIESGRTEPRYSTIAGLAKIFNVPVATFFLEDSIAISSFMSLKFATNTQLLDELNFRLNEPH